ncbi:MAG: hypothetical protein ACRDQA_24685 [Nocardioidaceae bacterium]
MKAAVVEQLGEVPCCLDVDEPQARDGLVVAQVRTAAIKNIERSLVAGTHYGSARMDLPALFAMLVEGTLSVATVSRPLTQVADAWAEPAPSGVRPVLVP